jgi:hypothetical protein
MKRFIAVLAGFVFATAANAQTTLVFVPDGGTTRGGAIQLDQFTDESICEVTPVSAAPYFANKIVGLANWNAILGDDDGNGDFFEESMGAVDAMALHPAFVANKYGNPEVFDFIFSSAYTFGFFWNTSVEDGSLWRVVKGAVAGGPVVSIFLSEAVLQAGLDTNSDVDIDALAFDSSGTMYVSFREDESILKGLDALEDGAIGAFASSTIVYDADGNISSLGSGTVRVVLHESDVDAIVSSIGLLDAVGVPVKTIGDLQALDVDPNGGTFVGSDGVTLWPNLFFAGATNGPRVLTTAGGGALAELNGVKLGEIASPAGSYLGLDGNGADLQAIQVIPARDDPICTDLEGYGLDAGDLFDVLWVGNATPFGKALVFVSLGTSAAGDNFASTAIAPSFRFPAFYAAPWFLLFGIGFNGTGQFALPFVLPPGLIGDLNLLVQIADITSSPAELSAPIVIAYDG